MECLVAEAPKKARLGVVALFVMRNTESPDCLYNQELKAVLSALMREVDHVTGGDRKPGSELAYEDLSRHFYFDEEGITDKIVTSRRLSSYFIPIAKPKKKRKQLELDTEWTKDRIEENKFINTSATSSVSGG